MVIAKEGYIHQQALNWDKTKLVWNKMLWRTFITAEEKKLPSHKPMKDGEEKDRQKQTSLNKYLFKKPASESDKIAA